MVRRDFVRVAAAFSAAGVAGCAGTVHPEPVPDLAYATLRARPSRRTESVKRGVQRLGIASERDGFLYVPSSYSAGNPAPLIVLLHGAGSSSSDWSGFLFTKLFDDPPVIVLAPDSRDRLWDVSMGGFGQDVRFIDDALDLTFGMCNVDTSHIALGGFSDGASYTLSLGLTNGDLFTNLMAFSPGYMKPAAKRGKPKIFIAQGRRDAVLPISTTRNVIVPSLRKDGYDVDFEEFDGPHTVKLDELAGAMHWFLMEPTR